MVNVKSFVLLFYVIFCACCSKYCEICPDHVLCKYPIPGPSVTCEEYDENSFLTDHDINNLVNQINLRRNFIAMGKSTHLPGAANMNKVVWSEELAKFAQRWVDQCDPSLRPDKEDQCRHLEFQDVGQIVTSILKPSPGFKVKSFVEIWFMQSLDYTGRVTYYDQFQDRNTKYFTQLVWAETMYVGCGRAKFNVNNVNIERIVCNFSPKGNNHGRPVYVIGFPATQCGREMIPDEKFKGLCTRAHRSQTKLKTVNLPVSSLLRILNLSNDSVKQEIDPIYNNINQTNRNMNEVKNPRHPIMRHINRHKVFPGKSNNPYQNTFRKSPLNESKNYEKYFHGHEDVHSRLHHGQDQIKNYRKYDEEQNSEIYSSEKNAKILQKQCTRRSEYPNNNCEHISTIPYIKITPQCTRGQKTNCEIVSRSSVTIPIISKLQHVVPDKFCPCSTNTVSATYEKLEEDIDCECVGTKSPIERCPNTHRRVISSATSPKIPWTYYVDKNNKKIYKDPNPEAEDDDDWLFNKDSKNKHYHRGRNKREFRDLSTSKPFWQIDSINNNRSPQLKSMRYTTLQNRRRPKVKKYPTKSITTETITIKLNNSNMKPVTEKYLSFDELLHLRKFNITSYSDRRQMGPVNSQNSTETDENETSTEYTTNTPFIHLKHCTRKMTCTWTAASITDKDGNVIAQGGASGSKTPPGYVEGCTRTSTCTRDYMNRNKFPTTISSSSVDDEDADYCERRSLNVRKRHSHNKRSLTYREEISDNNNDRRLNDLTSYNNLATDVKPISSLIKGYKKNKQKTNLSYGELYYLVLHKLMNSWENNRKTHSFSQCHCDRATEIHKLGIIILGTLVVSIVF